MLLWNFRNNKKIGIELIDYALLSKLFLLIIKSPCQSNFILKWPEFI